MALVATIAIFLLVFGIAEKAFCWRCSLDRSCELYCEPINYENVTRTPVCKNNKCYCAKPNTPLMEYYYLKNRPTNYTVHTQFECFYNDPDILLYLEDNKGREVYSYKSDRYETQIYIEKGHFNETYIENDQIHITPYIIHSCVARHWFLCLRYPDQIIHRSNHTSFEYNINLTEKGSKSLCPKNVLDLKKKYELFDYPLCEQRMIDQS